jgi:TPR repeat protein
MRIAATNGNARAQLVMGNIFERGDEGVEMNTAEAVTWFILASAQGNSEGATALERLRGM